MNQETARQQIDQWLATLPGDPPLVTHGDGRKLGNNRLIFETAFPNGNRPFIGRWIVFDLDTEQFWTTRHGWLEFAENLGRPNRIRRLWHRIRGYRTF